MKKRILAVLTAAVFVLLSVCSALPTPAKTEKPAVKFDTPTGYNEHDYQKMVTFLEYVDAYGHKNGERLSSDYDPQDPATWDNVLWTEGPEMRIDSVIFKTYYMSGSLDLSDCTALRNATVWEEVYGIDCSGCTALSAVDFRENGDYLESVDLSGCSKLISATINSSRLQEANFNGCALLENLEIGSHMMRELDLSGLASLKSVYCSYLGMERLILSGCSSLEMLVCSHNNLAELDVSDCVSLKALDFDSNHLSTLDLSQCHSLEQLSLANNRMSSIDVSGAPELFYLQLDGNLVEALDVSNNPALRTLICNNNKIAELDVSNNPLLECLVCGGNKIAELDLTNNPELPFDTIRAEGGGYIGTGYEGEAVADINGEARFEGWYTPEGELITEENTLSPYDIDERSVVARFRAPEVNESEYQQLLAILESTNENGVKIGTLINEDYDPDDITTWYYREYDEWGWISYECGIRWTTAEGEIRAMYIYLNDLGLDGELELSGFRSLDTFYCKSNSLTKLSVSDCNVLRNLNCFDNELTELNVSQCPELMFLTCSSNALTELDLSGLTRLNSLYCANNPLRELDLSPIGFYLTTLNCCDTELTELDLSSCRSLNILMCINTYITELDLSMLYRIGFGTILAEGNGYVGVAYISATSSEPAYHVAYAAPAEGEDFLGWYTEDGSFISNERSLPENPQEYSNIVARFGDEPDPIPGDASGDGIVDTTDALLVLRCALNISGSEEDMLAACDMNGDGKIDTTDALLVLRKALGIA